MKVIRVYADTSVFGGVFDDEYQIASERFFKLIRGKQFTLVTSAVVREELMIAPKRIQNLFAQIYKYAEIVDVSADALQLEDAYLKARIVPPKYSNDALHVALATVSKCELIVSWNFKHIVHFRKIPLYNKINLEQGYTEIGIFSPLEVITYEEKEI
jgi:predicted nucleic acid-binding protein